MRSILFATLLIVAAMPAAAATRTFPVGGFDRVRSTGPFDVHVVTGGAPHVHATGPDDVLARLQVRVERGELVIGSEPGNWMSSLWRRHDHVMIEVTAPQLAGVTLQGPGDVSVDRARAQTFSATLEGPGDLTIGTLDAGSADVRLSGPGDITIAGRVGRARIWLTGPGNVKGANLSTQDLAVDLRGPGDVTAMAARTANISLSGPGDVRVIGNPRCIVSKHGPGSVSCGR